MELTRRCDYACRILRSAYRHRDTYVSIADVAEEEDIPYAFARTIQHDLATTGFLKTIRGARGGLALAIDPSEKTVLDVLHALQGDIAFSPCSADPDTCNKSEACSFNKVWFVADSLLNQLFSSITLQDVFSEDEGASKLDELLKNTTESMTISVK